MFVIEFKKDFPGRAKVLVLYNYINNLNIISVLFFHIDTIAVFA